MTRYICRKGEIIGLFYLRDLIRKKFNVETLEDRHYQKISAAIDGVDIYYKDPTSKRTVRRLLKFVLNMI